MSISVFFARLSRIFSALANSLPLRGNSASFSASRLRLIRPRVWSSEAGTPLAVGEFTWTFPAVRAGVSLEHILPLSSPKSPMLNVATDGAVSASLTAFDHRPRTRLIFGPGCLAQLGVLAREMGGTRVLLVTDHGLVAAGHVDRARRFLADVGLEVTVYADVHENPTTEDVARCLAVAQTTRTELFVGLGGGSSLDTAKGTNLLLSHGGAIRDFWGVGKATKPMRPLLAIPTTAGTGSECQSAALIADATTHQKMACLDSKITPCIALLDPELTLSLPLRVTAATGVDALTHALETAVTTKRTPISELYSREAFRLCLQALPQVLAEPRNLTARGQLLLGAAYAGLAIENSMLGAAHAAANPLTATCNLVHGLAVGLMLPAVIRFNSADPGTRTRYAALATATGIAGPHLPEKLAVSALVERVVTVLNQAEIPRSLSAAGVPEGRTNELACEAMKQWTATFNPRPLTVGDFQALYREALTPR